MKISRRDWELLSAYLDGELDPRQASGLESRLEKQPALRTTLEGLKSTKEILSQTPEVPLPRNFTLTPAMVGISRKKSPVRGYRLAAAALSFLFIAVMVVDLGSGVLKGAMPLAQAPRLEEAMLESPPEAPADAIQAEEAAGEPEAMAVEEALESESPADEAPAVAQELTEAEEEWVEESMATGETPQEVEPEIAFEAEAEGATKSAPEEADRAFAGSDEEEMVDGEEFYNAPAPTMEQGETGLSLPSEEEVDHVTVQSPIPWMKVLEVVLGLGAAGFAVAAWIRRRRDI